MNREISTPVAQGTLISRLVWDNDKESDGIEIMLVRPDGNEDKLFEIASTEDGLSYELSVLLADLDEKLDLAVEMDEEHAVLNLESREKQGHDEEHAEEDASASR